MDIPDDFPTSVTTGWGVTVYNAQREETQCNEDNDVTELLAGRTGHIERVCGPWEITDQAAGSSDSKGYDVPGTYYIQAQVAEPKDEAKGIVVPISLTVDISGTPRAGNSPMFYFGDDAAQIPSSSGANATGGQGATGSAAAPEDDDSLVAKFAVPAGIGAAVLVIGGVTFSALRRRRAA